MYFNLPNSTSQLDRQFKQLLSAYNSLSYRNLNKQKRIYENPLRRNFYPRVPITANKFRYFNNNKIIDFNTLQKKIDKSLYPSGIKSNFYTLKRFKYPFNVINNLNSDLEENTVRKLSNPVLEDFKNTLMETQDLANKLFNQNNNFRFNNNRFNNFTVLNTYNNYLDNDDGNILFLDDENSENSLNLDYEDENDIKDFNLPNNDYMGRNKLDLSTK